jgi:hypothetical protein
MHINRPDEETYTDQDTERVRQAEYSSAGQPTRPLTPHPQPYTLPAPDADPAASLASNRRNNLIALALIAMGMLGILGQFLPSGDDFTGGMVLLTIASCFLFFAFWKRAYGLLIPGCILGGLSIGVPFAAVTHGVSVLWGLALGFLAILLIGGALFRVGSHWPAYPAVILFSVGVVVAVANLPFLLSSGMIWLPLLLIGAGLYLGWGRGNHSPRGF